MAQLQTSKKVKIIYTRESGRPDFITTEQNIQQQEKQHGNIIEDIIIMDDVQDITHEVIKPKLLERKEAKTCDCEITDEQLVKALNKRGKTAGSIAFYLFDSRTTLAVKRVEKMLE